MIIINQNIKKSPGDLRRLAVTQTSVEIHQLTLVGKTLKRLIIIIKAFHFVRNKYDFTIIYKALHNLEYKLLTVSIVTK